MRFHRYFFRPNIWRQDVILQAVHIHGMQEKVTEIFYEAEKDAIDSPAREHLFRDIQDQNHQSLTDVSWNNMTSKTSPN